MATSFAEIGSRPPLSDQEAWSLVEISQIVVQARDLADLERALPIVAAMMRSPSAVLYVADARLPAPHLLSYGKWSPETLEALCAAQFEHLASQATTSALDPATNLVLYLLQAGSECSGLLGLVAPENQSLDPPHTLERLLCVLAHAVDSLVERVISDRQLAHLNTYLTVSSLLVQSLNLHDILEGVLYCCMDAVSAEAASVLLLADDMKHFRFYHVEGPAKPVLKGVALPADEGIAGYVLQTQQPVVVGDAHEDHRFYQEFDSASGFRTRNMIAIPLTIGEEPIGVLEVLNKADADSFTQDEQMLLVSIAEEIALAIRNAKIFEYVAASYCKRQQGHPSCRGCHRPLGAWTPCVQYQKTDVTGLWQLPDAADLGASG